MEEIRSTAVTKEERYRELIPQIHSLISEESDPIANMANITAALKQAFTEFSWVGFYLHEDTSNELVLGPFQGKVACTRIGAGRGVCGAAFQRNETIIVPDVELFPGHIYCDGGTRSEIVIPVRHNKVPVGVLDVDSYALQCFDTIDQRYLEEIVDGHAERIIRKK
ncbi:MAG: GAF domain-containing protein [Bacteroidota bacterium]